MADPNYPEDLKYNADHDWARIDPDNPGEATFSGFAVHRPAAAHACWTWLISWVVGVRACSG